MYINIMVVDTKECRMRKNEEIKDFYRYPNIISEIKKRLGWAGHAWRKEESLIHLVLRNKPTGKRPLGRFRMRWEDQVKQLEPDTDWQSIPIFAYIYYNDNLFDG